MFSKIDQTINKHFEKVNREGVGFLSTNMNAAKKDLQEILVKEIADVVSHIVCEDGELFERVKSPAELFAYLEERYKKNEANTSKRQKS